MKIRLHAGGLDESMLTMQHIENTKEAIAQYLTIKFCKEISPTRVKIDRSYFATPDLRINWDQTYLISVGDSIVAFCDEAPIEDTPTSDLYAKFANWKSSAPTTAYLKYLLDCANVNSAIVERLGDYELLIRAPSGLVEKTNQIFAEHWYAGWLVEVKALGPEGKYINDVHLCYDINHNYDYYS